MGSSRAKLLANDGAAWQESQMTEADNTPDHRYCFGKAHEYMNIDDNTLDMLDLSSMKC